MQKRLAARLAIAWLLIALDSGAQAAPGPGGDRERDELLATQTRAMGVLGGWSVVSLGAGAGLLASGRTPFVRAIGVQQLAWGAIDGAIAAFSYRGIVADRARSEPGAYWQRERGKLSTVLAINVALDVLYVVVGASLWKFGKSDRVRGAGAGVIPQGGFLLAFDGAFLLSL